MATSQAASSGTAAAAAAIAETIVGSHMLKIDDFSGTKDLGVGKSIKSSTFNVGAHGWYIECYPCGVNEENAGWVTLFLCLAAHKEQVEAECHFYITVVDDDDVHLDDDYHLIINGYKHTYNAETSWRKGSDVVERAHLESLLEQGDCLEIRCDVYMVKEFLPDVLPPGLHGPLSDLVASGMSGHLTFQVGRELFTMHRGLPGSASPTSAGASSSTAGGMAADIDNLAGSHVLTIDGYSSAKEMCRRGNYVQSCFVVGGRRWYLQLYPSGKKDNDTDCLAVFLSSYYESQDKVEKVRFEFTLLTLAREIITSTQSCYIFSRKNCTFGCYFLFTMEPQSSLLLGDSFHVKCDLTFVKEITPMRPPDLHRHFGGLLASQVGTDVTFDVRGDLFSAHKLVLATRSTAFMAEFFGPGRDSTTFTRVRIDDMEPKLFRAFLHFIYTDTLPELHGDDDKVVMAQGLLVAADRYAMERLKLICGDMLCSYINDARTAITTMDLADKHGCPRLREACKKFLMDNIAKVAP